MAKIKHAEIYHAKKKERENFPIYGSTYIRMYSVPYYTYGSTANFLFLDSTALMYISKERRCNEDLRGIENITIEQVIK